MLKKTCGPPLILRQEDTDARYEIDREPLPLCKE